MGTATMLWMVLFGSIGMGYIVFGRQQRNPIALIAGIALSAYPMFVDNPWAIVGIGVVLMALPILIRV